MKKPGSIIRLICAVLAIPILAAILPVTAFADQGIVIMLKNTGPLPITGASLGFDVKPIDSWQTLEVTVGDGLGASNIGDFQVGVMPVSLDNPLPPGGTACVGPLSQLAPGDYVDIEAVDSYGNGFFSAVPPFREIMPRATVIPFYLVNSREEAGRIAGTFRFLSSVPDSCKKGYAPPFGKMQINSGVMLTTASAADLSLICYPTVGYTCQEMQFSNDNATWSAPEPYAKKKAWTLSPGDGEKTVYFRFKDSAGNWSDVYSGTIILSTPLAEIRSFPIPAFPDPGINITSLAFGEGKLFAMNQFYDSGSQTNREGIYVLDPGNGNILNSFEAPSLGGGLAADGGSLYENLFEPVQGDVIRFDSANGSALATLHPSGVSMNGALGGVTVLNNEIFQIAYTGNCDGVSIVRMNKEDGSFLGCSDVESLGVYGDELASDGTNLLLGAWVRDVLPDNFFWTVFTISPGGDLLKSNIIFSNQGKHYGSASEAWGDNQLFVVDRPGNRIIVYRFPSSGTVAPASLDFGEVLAGSTSMPHSLTISNTGAANLAISSVGIVGSGADTFSAVPGGPNPCPTLTPIVEPGRSCTLNVTFSPATAMKRSAILRVSLGSLNAQPIDVPLSGTGFDSLNVITPNGGELIPSGSTYSIRWTAPPSAVTFDLKYSVNGGTTWKSISDKVTGSSYDWHAPVPSGDKTGYLVKVLGYDAGGKSVGEDVSDSVFNMEIVKITSPHGGEILESGNIRSIKWQTNATVRPVGSVRLFYSMNGGLSWKSIKTVKGNTGSYDWTVPEVSGPNSGCRVKILLKDAGGTTVGSAISKGLFTIQQ